MKTSPTTGRVTAVGAVLLAAAVTVAVAVSLRWAGDDPLRRQSVMLAASTTAFGSLVGWLVARWGRNRNAGTAVAAGLGATLLRIAPPLAALAWLGGPGRPLRDAGAGGVLVAFYLLLLAVDIVLHIMVPRDRSLRTTPKPVN